MQDWNAKRPPLGRTAYRDRLRAVLRSKKTQGVAGRIAAGLLKVCKEVVKKKGAASRGGGVAGFARVRRARQKYFSLAMKFRLPHLINKGFACDSR